MYWIASLPFFGSALAQVAGSLSGSLIGRYTAEHLDTLSLTPIEPIDTPTVTVKEGATQKDTLTDPYTTPALVGLFSRDKDAAMALAGFVPALSAILIPQISSVAANLAVIGSLIASLGMTLHILGVDPDRYAERHIGPFRTASIVLFAVNTIGGVVVAILAQPPP